MSGNVFSMMATLMTVIIMMSVMVSTMGAVNDAFQTSHSTDSPTASGDHSTPPLMTKKAVRWLQQVVTGALGLAASLLFGRATDTVVKAIVTPRLELIP